MSFDRVLFGDISSKLGIHFFTTRHMEDTKKRVSFFYYVSNFYSSYSLNIFTSKLSSLLTLI